MSNQADTLQSEYRLRFAKLEKYRNDVWKILCNDFFRAFIPPESCVLDLGSGWGEFINNVRAATKYAMDMNPDAGTRLSEGIQFLQQDCSQPWQLPAGSLDVVFTSNFLEHLPDKAGVERTVAEARRCLKPGGLMICLGPNIRYVPGAYWDFWDHCIPLTNRSLAELLKLKGFHIRQNVSRFLPYSMSTGRTPPLFFVKTYLKLPALWPFFGKQFLVVGEKASGPV